MRIGNDHNLMLNDIPLLESAFQLAHIELLVCLTEKSCSFNRTWESPSKVGGNQWHFWPFKIIWDVAKPRFNIHTRFIFAARKREQITFTQKFFQLCDQDLFSQNWKGAWEHVGDLWKPSKPDTRDRTKFHIGKKIFGSHSQGKKRLSSVLSDMIRFTKLEIQPIGFWIPSPYNETTLTATHKYLNLTIAHPRIGYSVGNP